jgi:hypothetical protein
LTCFSSPFLSGLGIEEREIDSIIISISSNLLTLFFSLWHPFHYPLDFLLPQSIFSCFLFFLFDHDCLPSLVTYCVCDVTLSSPTCRCQNIIRYTRFICYATQNTNVSVRNSISDDSIIPKANEFCFFSEVKVCMTPRGKKLMIELGIHHFRSSVHNCLIFLEHQKMMTLGLRK